MDLQGGEAAGRVDIANADRIENSETSYDYLNVDRSAHSSIGHSASENNKDDDSGIVYVDLFNFAVTEVECTPARLEGTRRLFLAEARPQLAIATTTIAKTKRKLYTPKASYDDDDDKENNVPFVPGAPRGTSLNGADPIQFDTVDEQLEDTEFDQAIVQSPVRMYSFLRSLGSCITRCYCHPEALYYRDNFNAKKEDLARILYNLYNEKLFDDALDVSLKWNNTLRSTGGRCLFLSKMGQRSSVVELSVQVVSSADRLRCTLVHELCHAAAWNFNGEDGHGANWQNWASKANSVFPELPRLGVCRQYDIEYKYSYTYKCTQCAAALQANSKLTNVDRLRCFSCHGVIEVFNNRRNKAGKIIPTKVRAATGFAKFVKDHYKEFKRSDLKHGDVMKILGREYAAVKAAQQQC